MEKKSDGLAALRILCLEYSPEGARVIQETLARSGLGMVDHSGTAAEFKSLLGSRAYDIILADYSVPGLDGLAALRLASILRPETPFICVAGSADEEAAVEVMRAGAADYVMRGRIEKLPLAITRAAAEAKARKSLKLAERERIRLMLMLDAAPSAITIHDFDGRYLYINRKTLDLHGYTRDEYMALTVSQVDVPESGQLFEQRCKELLDRGETTFEASHFKKDGTILPLEIVAKVIYWNDIGVILSIGTDITGRKLAERKLREKEYMLSESQRLGHVGSWFFNMSGQTIWSDELYRLYGVSTDTFTPTVESLLSLIHPKDRSAMRGWITDCVEGKRPGDLEYRIILPDGTIRFFNGAGQMVAQNGNSYIAGIVHEITERVKATEALKKNNLELEAAKKLLENKNIALREVLDEIESEKNKLKDEIVINIKKIILPIVKKIRLRGASRYPALLEKSLQNLVSSFGRRLTEKDLGLTPKELEICNMIKSGLTTKEIAGLLDASRHTVDKHRNSIRKKLGLSKKGVNLTSFLQSL